MTTKRQTKQPTLAEVRKWPATVSVAQAATALGISKSHLHALISRGEAPVRTLPLGRCQRVVTADLVTVLSGGSEAA
ncbi:helix-turn-helix domain-containing protein [Streptomyces sp. S1A]|uniref:helix-turn-helix domain-containing protein n=1 Tax=Streptomyces sp. ICN903 TaxID=2964654 RepID=UPI001EDC09FF|nr:helix-turn-helix domain-containing protein [Streptomyces sp. ICN903]MCG3039177.1 helix-turn-helix domain-containing protein [Streptomyces sp. ICN903]